MECSFCGGLLKWQGPISNLTYTKCTNCGAINGHLKDDNNVDTLECAAFRQDMDPEYRSDE